MKLATYSARGETPVIGAVLPDTGRLLRLQAAFEAHGAMPGVFFVDMLALMRGGEAALDRARELVTRATGDEPFTDAPEDVKLLAPVPVPEQIRDFSTFDLHMRQAGAAMARLRAQRRGESTHGLPTAENIPLPPVYYEQPVYYKANRFSVVGHGQDIRWPGGAARLDYEAEFGVFIGRSGRDIAASRADAHMFGFTIFNDFSARDLQEHEMEAPFGPAKGKDFDTGNALGPWIVTVDEVGNPRDLMVIVRVNGEEWSRGSTSAMRYGFDEIIAHVSRNETLHVGEFLGSGTVGGGCGLELDRWIQPGDIVEIEVEKLGVLRNRVLAPAT